MRQYHHPNRPAEQLDWKQRAEAEQQWYDRRRSRLRYMSVRQHDEQSTQRYTERASASPDDEQRGSALRFAI